MAMQRGPLKKPRKTADFSNARKRAMPAALRAALAENFLVNRRLTVYISPKCTNVERRRVPD
jgi:hypothetical protein